jgi:UDP-N-acetylglucosamine--N-acetylmuramyl-(pentapeptide) pyrophosphoryl-undecaprenol N-acetylglucosamine transferase
MRIVLTGGGTGGHIYPALTLWQYVRSHHPEAEALYIGTEQGLEKNIVAKTDIPFMTIPAAGLKRQFSLSAIRTALVTFGGYRLARRKLYKWKPDIVVGTGGYVTLPVIFAAHRMGIPSVVWEGNARPGLTNQLCAKRAEAVAVSFEHTEGFLRGAKKVVFTGNPRASEVLHIPDAARKSAREKYRLSSDKPTILIFSGSRGAETVNLVVVELMTKLIARPDWRVIFVTGDKHYDSVCGLLPKLPHHITVLPFIYDMQNLLPNVDVVVTRAGSATLAEICSLGIASILIPSPYVTANHQEENAKRLSSQNAAILLKEQELSSDSLWASLVRAIDSQEGKMMRENARRLATPHAAEALYQLVMDVYDSRFR